MSVSTKLRTTLPNNNLKSISGTQQSRVYRDAQSLIGPVEDVMYAHDVRQNLPIIGNQSVITVPLTWKIMQDMFILVKLADPNAETVDDVNTNKDPHVFTGAEDYWLTRQMERVRIKIPGSEMLDLTPWDQINFLQLNDDKFKREKYLDLNGRAFTKLRKGDELFVLLPLPWCSLNSGRKKSKPLPNHLLSEPITITIEWVNAALFESIEFCFFYADLGESHQYRTSFYEIPYKQMYNHSFKLSSISPTLPPFDTINGKFYLKNRDSMKGDSRSVILQGLKQGETQELYVRVVQVAKASTSLALSGTGATKTIPLHWFQRDENYLSSNYNRGMKYGERIRNLQIKFAGQIIWDSNTKKMEEIVEFLTHEEKDSRTELPLSQNVIQGFAFRNRPFGVLKGPLISDYTSKVRNPQVSAVWETDVTPGVPHSDYVESEKIWFNYTHGTDPQKALEIRKYAYPNVSGSQNDKFTQSLIPTTLVNIAAGVDTPGINEYHKYVQITGPDGAAPGASRSGQYVFASHTYKDYCYRINLAELPNEVMDTYSLGVDFAYGQPEMTFRIDSDDKDELCALAKNCGEYVVILSQSLQSVLKFANGQTILAQ